MTIGEALSDDSFILFLSLAAGGTLTHRLRARLTALLVPHQPLVLLR